MKPIILFSFILALANSAAAQYIQNPANNTGIYSTQSNAGDQMTITLNPNKTNFTVNYSFVNPFNKAVLIVMENSGRVIVQKEIEKSEDQLIIATDKWPGGQYTVSLFADKKTVITQKLTINK